MIRKFIVLCVVIMCAIATMPLGQSPSPPSVGNRRLVHSLAKSIMEKKLKQSEYRLPCNTVPHVYVIDLDPDFLGDKFTFKGNCTIIFEVLRPTTTVTLHRSDKMDIEQEATELIDANGDIKKPLSQKWNPANNFFSMKFRTRLNVGNYSLKMSWTGRDGADDWYSPHSGFYRATDGDEHEPKYLITTHFEPTFARQVFPCWDEPGMKAQFEFSITHYPNYTALSNMPVKNRKELSDGKVLTKFERSPKMSSYLPCLAVANYKHIENIHGNITFYTQESYLDSVKHALEISEKVIPAMESYTGIAYAFPKLDQITIPQYDATAMEHWGLVSYITHSVLTDNSTILPNVDEKMSIDALVAHELSHQWFGNLVTPIWWNDAWLNEAFAAYFQYKVLELIYPEGRIMDIFVIEHVNRQSFPAAKRSRHSKPIKWNPTTIIDINRMFSEITYAKGAGVLHMLDHMLGENVFRDGIRRYMTAHQFTAVNTDDLWDDLQAAYDDENKDKPLNIKETMDPWIEQTGYPIVTVTRNYDTGDVVLTQKNAMSSDPNNKWKIPLNYATKSNPDFTSTLPTMWFNKDDDNVTIPNINKDDWIILNIQQRGFYRVQYDEENWRRLADYLNTDDYSKISPINRAQLILDAFEMIRKANIEDGTDIIRLVNIMSYLHRETDYVAWIPAAEIMGQCSPIFQNTPIEKIFNEYMLSLMHKILDDADGDSYVNVKVKSMLMPYACEFGSVKCKDSAKSILNKYLENGIDREFYNYDNQWVICAGLAEANETVWDSLMETMNHTDLHYTPYRYLRCSKSDEIRNKYLNRLFTTNITDDLSDIVHLFRKFDRNREIADYMIKYFINNFDLIENFFEEKNDTDSVLVMIAIVNMAIRSQDQYEKFKAFLEPRLETLKVKLNEPGMDKMLEELNDNIEFIEIQTTRFRKLLEKRMTGSNAIKMDEKI